MFKYHKKATKVSQIANDSHLVFLKGQNIGNDRVFSEWFFPVGRNRFTYTLRITVQNWSMQRFIAGGGSLHSNFHMKSSFVRGREKGYRATSTWSQQGCHISVSSKFLIFPWYSAIFSWQLIFYFFVKSKTNVFPDIPVDNPTIYWLYLKGNILTAKRFGQPPKWR